MDSSKKNRAPYGEGYPAKTENFNNNDLRSKSQQYLQSGLSVIPAYPETKKPTIEWKVYQTMSMTLDAAKKLSWPGIAAITGYRNLEILDFDYKAKWFEPWEALVEAEAPGLVSRLLIEKSQSGGKHGFYRCHDVEIPGNTKLAHNKIEVDGPGDHIFDGKTLKAIREGDKWFILPCYIETRGTGGYALISPTRGYEVEQGDFLNIPEITPAERHLLIRCAKALNRHVKPGYHKQPTIDGDRPGDLYNEKADVRALLEKHGWAPAGSRGNFEHWTRPGKNRGISASLIDGKLFHVFTTNGTPLESNRVYTPFQLYTEFEHGGDFEAAAKDLYRQGYRSEKQGDHKDPRDDADNIQKEALKNAEEKKTQFQLLMKIAENLPLFHDSENNVYVMPVIGGHKELINVDSRAFKNYLNRNLYEQTKKAAYNDAIKQVISVLSGKGLFESPEIKVDVRIASHDGNIFLDLNDTCRNAAKITPIGPVRCINDYPVYFKRSKGSLSLVNPKPGGNINQLRDFLNVKSDEDFRLIIAWMVQALRPIGPYPILVINGEQGTAKSTMSRLIRELIDPNTAPLRSLPRSERDLAIQCNNSWIQVIENVSYIPDWLSDALCRLSTGGGFSTRTLYENDEEQLFSHQRPIILNGITNFVNKHDLADRCLMVTLDPIPDDKRIPEADLIEKFKEAAPYILGALLDAVSIALKNIESTKLKNLPRMADFALWVTAAEPALPWEPGGFMQAYDKKRAEAVQDAVDSSPVGSAIQRLMEDRNEWEGTPAELLSELEKIVDETTVKMKVWPKAANTLSRKVTETSSFLRKIGIDIEKGHDGNRRFFKIRKNIVSTVSIVRTQQTRAFQTNDKDNGIVSPNDSIVSGQSIVSTEMPMNKGIYDTNDTNGKKHTFRKERPDKIKI